MASRTLLNEKFNITSHVVPKEIGLNVIECFSDTQMGDRGGMEFDQQSLNKGITRIQLDNALE